MNLVEDKIVHLLTGKHNLFEVSVDELQAISDEQPFFSVAQLLLTQKMKQVNHPGFVQQLQKTALFFPNIFWLDKHLQESSPQVQPAAPPPPAAIPTQQPSFETTIHTPAVNTNTATSYDTATNAIPEPPAAAFTASSDPRYYKEEEDDLNPITAQYGQQDPATAVTSPAPAEQATTPADAPEPVSTIDTAEASSPEELLAVATDRIDEPVTEQPTEAPVAAAWEEQAAHITTSEDPQPVYPGYTTAVIEEVTGDTPTSVEVITNPVTAPYVAPEPEAAATPPVTDASIEAEAPPAALAQDTQEAAAGYEHSIKESFANNTSNDFGSDDEDDLPVDALGETGDNMEAPSLRLAEIMQQQANTFNKPVAENEVLPIESEPYHTIDYFASQGIKAEGNAEDGLAKKVRKFTDWLKQMKKVAPLPSDLGTDAELEQVVHGIAATSIEAKEVVTEAMAEVLVKQGRIDKAVLLYSKLSFLNPDKTAYFAAKILELKGN
ncbi:hypothetical protein [Filimonas effusa]|uniref:Uncharacterized protein n=1 Tax=Filimonas effusa TaxID=2508721 RepID=A0A4Q1DCF5_9BACT|nr:hypothetical protein [Filimonas effusa]RXK86303.1 hypothetical protein ESB13_05720 [Filimonas effusa]